ncbi:restriction endonuclease subunit S [Photobacterium damselae]|uniref:restriction endonuclease subunit S n=1 Tax=Photobacterium damselae TaxID=38293 RepID=UPI000D93C972|nr:restriction endonuclease subunit S [Photobacterium damselae]NVO73584.1 restriction endonuclease subunit S [Photobacterium damselae subsp. damselae]SPY30529.1 Type I restriction enzyme EcoKI specificity protein [Photobacterium damselae]
MSKYQAYPEYKDSGVDWLGDIPKHWNIKKGSYIGRLFGSESIAEKNISHVGKTPFIKVSDLSSDKFKPNKFNWYVSENIDSYCHTEKDFIVFPKRGAAIFTNKVNIISTSSLIDPNLMGWKINKSTNTNYMAYLLKSRGLSDIADISTVPQINNKHIEPEKFTVPTINEQTKIVAFLDHETAKIDTLIEKQQQLIELLKEKRQAVISHAVTKGLNPDAPMKDSGVEWLGEVPEHWVVLRLKHLIQSLESGCSVNAADIPAKDNEIGVLKTSCVYTRQFRVEENKTVILDDLSRVKCPIRKGAIIISRMNTPELVGASALVDIEAKNIYLPDRLWQTIFNDDYAINSEYLAHFMAVTGFRNQISLAAEGASSSMQNIAKEDYLAINTLLPSLNEQLNIVEYLHLTTDKFDELVNKANTAINLMQERRTALISAAVTGKIDVRNWVAPTTSSDTNEAQHEVTA